MNENSLKQPSEEDWRNAFQQAQQPVPRPNILVCGYTGCGKTSLIKALLGDVVPEGKIGAGKPLTQGFDCYENHLVRIYDSKGMENGDSEAAFLDVTRDFIRKTREKDLMTTDNHIHLVWYAIQAPGARVTNTDRELIQNIFNPKDVIVCLTKADGARGNQKEAMKQEVMKAGIPEERIIFTSDEEGGSIGCSELMERSLQMLPAAYKDAFAEAQKVNQELQIETVRKKKGKAKAIIVTASTAAAGIGFVPIPCSDAPLLVAGQTTMIASLAALYGIGFDAVKVGLLPFLAKVAGTSLASSLLKSIPGLGTLLGGMMTAAIATALTGAMGWYVQTYFEKCAIAKIKNEPMPEIPWNPEAFKQFYEQYKKESKG